MTSLLWQVLSWWAAVTAVLACLLAVTIGCQWFGRRARQVAAPASLRAAAVSALDARTDREAQQAAGLSCR
jgi:uncharacterized membrane protein